MSTTAGPHTNPFPQEALVGELLEEAALTLDELARACRVPPGWVIERVESGLIDVSPSQPGVWRFTSASLVRARRLVSLETTFDAAPELAALTTDLIEEVAQLRQRLRDAGLDE